MEDAVNNHTFPSPGILAHVDWSTSPKKRWITLATKASKHDATWHIHAPQRLSTFLQNQPPHHLHDALNIRAHGQGALLGIDMPIGLPCTPTIHAELTSFHHLLDLLAQKHLSWKNFLTPCKTHHDISAYQPFYPHSPKGSKRQHLLDGLHLSNWNQLLRTCEYHQAGGSKPCPLYWTVGANQVGKGAIKGWSTLLLPLHQDRRLRIWPIDGTLHELLTPQQPHQLTIAEVYPAEIYTWLGLHWQAKTGKRHHTARMQQSAPLLNALEELPTTLSEDALHALQDGFGDNATAEDAFDSFIGLLGILMILYNKQPHHEPPRSIHTKIEGWILGRQPPKPSSTGQPQ